MDTLENNGQPLTHQRFTQQNGQKILKYSILSIVILIIMIATMYSISNSVNKGFVANDQQNVTNLSNLNLNEFQLLDSMILQEFSDFQIQSIKTHNQKTLGLRMEQFPHMKNKVYTDATGAGLYTKDQIDNYSQMLQQELFCNTHSINQCAEHSQRRIENARVQILSFLGLNDSTLYSVIFTKSTTHSLQVLNDILPISNKSKFAFSRHSHTSVLGLRNKFSKNNQIKLDIDFYRNQYHTKEYNFNSVLSRNNQEYLSKSDIYDIFAIPAKDNYVGVNYNLDVINYLNMKDDINAVLSSDSKRESNRHVLTILDAAAYLQTQQLDLAKVQPHFIVFSLYKIFGFPTSVGCLIMRNDVIQLLDKHYYGGGSTVVMDMETDFVGFKKNLEKYEDGTLDYLGISSIQFGLTAIYSIGIANIDMQTQFLSTYLFKWLVKQKYKNGKRKFEVYNDETNIHNIVTFNGIDRAGKYISYFLLTSQLNDMNIIVRSGSQCNPGAMQHYCGLPATVLEELYATKESCADKVDIWEDKCLGAIRVSFGYWNTLGDLSKFIEAITLIVDEYHE